jgi:hypothetical protein
LIFLNHCIVGAYRAARFFLPALFDYGDFFAREAVKGIDKLVDLGLRGENIRILSASVVRLSRFRRRCNETMLTFSGLGERRSV